MGFINSVTQLAPDSNYIVNVYWQETMDFSLSNNLPLSQDPCSSELELYQSDATMYSQLPSTYVPTGRSNPQWNESIRYGQRLLPQVLDDRATRNPQELYAIVAKSSDVRQGVLNISIGDVSRAVNYMSWWIDSTVGKRTGSEVMAYMVFHIRHEEFKLLKWYQGPSDVRYVVLILAAIKTGFPVCIIGFLVLNASFQFSNFDLCLIMWSGSPSICSQFPHQQLVAIGNYQLFDDIACWSF